MGAFDHIEAGTDVAELLERRRFEHAKQQTGEAVPALRCVRDHRPYWLATMQVIGCCQPLCC